MDLAIQVEKLSFNYGSHEVLNSLNFSLKKGSFYCLLGRNGVGKSTLIRCLLGLDHQYRGKILVEGKDQRNFSPRELAKKMAYIPQTVDSVYEYTVEQFILMGRAAHLNAFQAPTLEDKIIVADVLQRLGMSALGKKSIAKISGGERQLATIARALVQQSPILIMDEPTASLDYGNQIRLMSLGSSLARQGYLIFMSCHNPYQAKEFADEVMVLDQGRILALGDAKEIITPELINRVYGLEREDVPC